MDYSIPIQYKCECPTALQIATPSQLHPNSIVVPCCAAHAGLCLVLLQVPEDVDFRVMGTFVDFYTTLLGFVNWRLYSSINTVYPPKVGDRAAGQWIAFLPLQHTHNPYLFLRWATAHPVVKSDADQDAKDAGLSALVLEDISGRRGRRF